MTSDTRSEPRNWMTGLRGYVQRYWPYEQLLPSDEPIYVSRLFYLFGSLALMSFVGLIVTGVVLVAEGPYWWHTSSAGLFVNSLHFWAVQVFFFSIFVHLGSSFFTAAWRGGRGFTWVFGALTFLTAVFTGLTGYILQSNYDGQYIGEQAKDALNAVGIGAFLNVMDLDQVTGWHVVLLPLGVTALLALHLLWVRRHGVVPPFPAPGTDFHGAADPGGPSRADAGSSTHSGYVNEEEQR